VFLDSEGYKGTGQIMAHDAKFSILMYYMMMPEVLDHSVKMKLSYIGGHCNNNVWEVPSSFSGELLIGLTEVFC